MKRDFLTQLGIIFKRITGVRDISAMQKEIHKRIGQKIYRQTYTANDIVSIMISQGMQKGSTVCIHAAMKEFYNYRGTAEELLLKIMESITSDGTLLMPAFPDQAKFTDKNTIFDPDTEPTKAGYLAETFRKMPGVMRSFNVQHSVCAWGKHASWLIQDHHLGQNCWDEMSPWFRMTQLNALVFSLGLNSTYIGTFDHCVEALLYKDYTYWAQFFRAKREYRFKAPDGSVKTYTSLICDIDRRTCERRLTKHFEESIFKRKKLSNLLIKVFYSKPCLDKMIELGKKGITMYYVPSTKGHHFDI